METIALIFTIMTCLLHGCFFILEMFLWANPIGLKVFHQKKATANSSKLLAANQGLYNLMLAFGLFVSFFLPGNASVAIRIYCLFFVTVVGCYGAYSLKNYKVFAIQALPA